MDGLFNFLADYYFIFIGIRKKKTEVETASDTAQPNMNQEEPMGVQLDSFAPIEPEVVNNPMPTTNVPVTPEPVMPATVNDINAGIPLPPEEPVKSDEPTLIIEDPSTSSLSATPVQPQQSLFEVPDQNNTNQNM